MHLVKRYSNRKLYDSTDRRQITLEGISQIVRSGEDVKVVDNDTEEDITTVILTEILLERERRSSTGPFSKTVLTGLVQAGTATFEQFRRTITGMGIVQLAEQEMERVVNTAIELGHMTEQEVLHSVEGVIERRRKARGDVDQVVEARIASAIKRADMPTRDEFNRLVAQLHGLNVQIGTLVDELHRARRQNGGS